MQKKSYAPDGAVGRDIFVARIIGFNSDSPPAHSWQEEMNDPTGVPYTDNLSGGRQGDITDIPYINPAYDINGGTYAVGSLVMMRLKGWVSNGNTQGPTYEIMAGFGSSCTQIVTNVTCSNNGFTPTAYPSAASNQGTGQAWSNPTNIEHDDGNQATVALTSSTTSQLIYGQNFNFNPAVPSGATISGIQVWWKQASTVASAVQDNTVSIILSSGSLGSQNKAGSGYWPTTSTYASYGGSSDLWGQSWSYTDFANPNFGAAISAKSNANSVAGLDALLIQVFYSTSTPGLVASIAWIRGSFTVSQVPC